MNFTKTLFLLFTFSFLLFSAACFADVKLPSVISDGMVLQQNSNVPIWGWAQPGEKIEVKLVDCDTATTVTDQTGKWLLKIKTPKAGGPYEMIVTGKNILLVRNILIGEVWVCSGQSNMEMPVAYEAAYYTGVMNWEKEVLAANYPKIRLFKVKKETSQVPLTDCSGSWMQCAPATAADFSAVAYFFGRDLHKQLNVPVGLIQAAWGGTPAEAWTQRWILEYDLDFSPILKRFNEAVANYPKALQEYLQKMKDWEKAADDARAKGQKPPYEPFAPMGSNYQNAPSGLYNAMIRPLMPYAIRGVIWYQGEGNADRPYQYCDLFTAMLVNWRRDWGEEYFPFYYVQIAPFDYKTFFKAKTMYAPELREAQLFAMSFPNTGMAVTMDIGDLNDVHPKNKQEVGRRLALWALAKTYGKTGIVYSGPIYKSMKVEGDKIRIHFNYIGSGLLAKGGPLNNFTIAGEDKNFVDAKAVIDGDTVVVSSDKVQKPVEVRYAWSNTAQPNLFNREGLPASPFRTDHWPTGPEKLQ